MKLTPTSAVQATHILEERTGQALGYWLPDTCGSAISGHLAVQVVSTSPLFIPGTRGWPPVPSESLAQSLIR